MTNERLKAVVWNAGKTPQLVVDGTAQCFTSKQTLSVSEAVPQGINPTELILEVVVEEKTSPMKGTFVAFPTFQKAVTTGQYKTVRARFRRSVDGEPQAENEADQVIDVVTSTVGI